MICRTLVGSRGSIGSMFPLQLDVAEFTCGLLNPLLPSRIAIAMYSWASSARPPNSILRLLDFRSRCTFRAVMTLERSLKKLEISGQSASSLGENVLYNSPFDCRICFKHITCDTRVVHQVQGSRCLLDK